MIKSTKIYVVITPWSDDDERAFTSLGAAYNYKDWIANSDVEREMIQVKEMYLESDEMIND